MPYYENNPPGPSTRTVLALALAALAAALLLIGACSGALFGIRYPLSLLPALVPAALALLVFLLDGRARR